MKAPEPHAHSYDQEIVKKVPLHSEKGGIIAFDLFKQRKCACGAKTAVTRERQMV